MKKRKKVMGKIKLIINYLGSIDSKLDVILNSLNKGKKTCSGPDPSIDEMSRSYNNKKIEESSKMLMYNLASRMIDDILTLKEQDPISTDDYDSLIEEFFSTNGFSRIEDDIMRLLMRNGYVSDDEIDIPPSAPLHLAVMEIVQDTIDSKGLIMEQSKVQEIAGIVINSDSAWTEFDNFVNEIVDENNN